jgi:hypothetical protein
MFVAWWKGLKLCRTGADEGLPFAVSLLTLLMLDGLLSSLVIGRGFFNLLLLIVLFGIARESTLDRAHEEARRSVPGESAESHSS